MEEPVYPQSLLGEAIPHTRSSSQIPILLLTILPDSPPWMGPHAAERQATQE